MTPETFFENFAHIAEAPNGVKKLRELILQMAVRGALVPQDSSDEPAVRLLERIQAEKARLVKEKIRKSDPLPAITLEEELYSLPLGWEWVRLGDVVEVLDSQRIPITKDARKAGPYPYYGASGIVDYVSDYIFDEQLVLVGEDGAKWRRGDHTAFIISGKTWVNNHAHVLRPQRIAIIDRYIVISLVEQDLQPYITGMTVPKLNQARLNTIVLPLPPLVEQHRIVAKVDQLMTLCDELEAKQQRTRVKLTLLNNAALDRLTSACAADDFTVAWHLLRDNFDLLYTTPETIAKLRQSILQLAVQGKLVDQDPNDEPATVLLAKIKAEKARLVKEKKIRKSDPLPPVTAEEALHSLPKGWVWARLGEIIAVMDSGWSPACHDWATRNDDAWGVLKTTAVQSLEYRNYEHKELPSNLSPRPEYEVNKGDILITRAGPKNRVGICCLVKETRHKLMISDKIIRFNLAGEIIFDGFIALCLNAGGSKDYIENQKSGMAESQMNVTQPKLKLTPVAIPPYDEQHRIVAKVNQLMSLCDSLESRLMKAEAKAEKLTTAAVQRLLTA